MIRNSRLAMFLFVVACAPVQPPVTTAGTSGGAVAWDSLVKSFIDSYFATRPDIAVNAGRHEYDGRLPDYSEQGLARQIAMLTDGRARAVAFDTTSLDAPRRLEREYLIATADGLLWWLTKADGPHNNPAWYSGALDPDVYLTRPYAPLDQRMRAYTAYARSIVRATPQIRANLKTPLPRTFIDRGRGCVARIPPSNPDRELRRWTGSVPQHALRHRESRHTARRAGANRSRGPRAQSKCATLGVRAVCSRSVHR